MNTKAVTARGREKRTAWRIVSPLSAVIALAVALRVWRLGERSVWFDEAFSWRLAAFPWREMLQRTVLDNHPPFHFMALKIWMTLFGESPITMRLLSVLSGTAACVGMYLLMLEAYSHPRSARYGATTATPHARWLALCTALFVAINVVQIRWSWEIRGYAMGAGLAALSGWLLLRAIRVNSRCAWALYVAAGIPFVYTHIYALFSLTAQAIYVVGVMRAEWPPDGTPSANNWRPMRSLVAGSVVFGAWLLWLPAVLEQRAHVHRDMSGWPLQYWSVGESCYQLWLEPQEPSRDPRTNSVAMMGCALFLGSLLWRPTRGDWFLFLSAVVPPLLGAAVSLVDVPMYHSHYLVFAQLFLLAALARLLGRIGHEPERTVVAAVVVVNMLFIYVAWWNRLDVHKKPGLQAAVASIEQSRGAGEPLVVTSPFYFPPVLLYARDRASCRLLDDGHTFRHYEGAGALKPADFIRPDELGALTARRVWVINAKDGGWGRTSLAPPRHWRERTRGEFPEVYSVQGKVEVIEYDIASSAAGA